MTELVISIVILAVYIAACVACWARANQLEHRRLRRNQLRLIRRYNAAHEDTLGRVVFLDQHSRKVA